MLLFPSLLFSQVSAAPLITRLAGSGSSIFNGDQGLGITINLDAPTFVVFDAAGNEYLSDTGHNCVRRIDSSGNMTTVAGLLQVLFPASCLGCGLRGVAVCAECHARVRRTPRPACPKAWSTTCRRIIRCDRCSCTRPRRTHRTSEW